MLGVASTPTCSKTIMEQVHEVFSYMNGDGASFVS